MKKGLYLVLSILIICTSLSLAGCNFEPPVHDFNADVQTVLPEDITAEHFTPKTDETYYTSAGLSLWAEVNGHYLKIDYFTLDGTKRVYDNLYLYEGDYFLMSSDDTRYWFAALADSANTEYVEEERASGEEFQINVKKSGIYRLIFDTDTLKFDIEYKSEIDTPLYYTMPSCSIYTERTSWVQMSVNPENGDEFVISDFDISAGEYISFFSNIHTSNYKVTLEGNAEGRYATASETTVWINVGGRYDVYVNKRNYTVRLELTSPDTAEYSCIYYDGADFVELTPYDPDTPYLFRQRIVVDTKYTTSLPKFYTSKYKAYALTVVDAEGLLSSTEKNHYFKNVGTYDVIINLKTFEISVELLPE